VSELLLERIRSHLSSGVPHPSVTEDLVRNARARLGFKIPKLLEDCYLRIGNGGFGPGYGVIGLEGGHASDFGSLVSTFEQLKSDQEQEGYAWPEGMLPFNGWGCNTFSCVDCMGGEALVYTFEDFELSEAGYDLPTFFDLWLSGVDALAHSQTNPPRQRVMITNPFTGEKAVVRGKRGK
jgi:hypothetical protein